MTHQINEENIRVAAYYIWEQAGRPEGAEKECWMKACEQLFQSQSPVAQKSASKSKSSSVKASAKSSKSTGTQNKSSAKKSSAKPTVKAEPFYGIRK